MGTSNSKSRSSASSKSRASASNQIRKSITNARSAVKKAVGIIPPTGGGGRGRP